MSSNTSLSPLDAGNQQAAQAVTRTISHVLMIFTILLGIGGNSLVIWVAGFKLKVRLPARAVGGANPDWLRAVFVFQPNVTNVWLVNLAVADLIFCFTRVLSLVKKLAFEVWPYGLFVCRSVGFFKYTNMFCSVFLLAVISLDRLLCIWWPFFAKRRRTLRAARALALGVWGAALLLSTPYFVYRRVLPGEQNLSMCTLDFKEAHSATKTALYANRFLCGFLLPFLVILVCYILAGVRIRRTRLAGKSRPLRILASLVSAFFLCWAPYHCLQMVKLVKGKDAMVALVYPLVSSVAYFNSCINPLLYFCMGLQVRGHFRQSLTAVYKRALEETAERQMTPSNERSLDDSTTSKHSTATAMGRSLAQATPSVV